MIDDPLHTLSRSLSPFDRIGDITAHLTALGWRVRTVPGWMTSLGWRNSFAAPWRTIYISAATRERPADERAAVLAHEATHARQFERAWSRWGRAVWYLLSPFQRRWMEVEAEAWEAATSAAHAHAGLTLGAMLRHTSAGALGGWQWPHLTGGDPETLRCGVAERALELARRTNGGRDA